MIYSSLKAIHHQDRIDDLKKGRLIFPTQVQIDLTNKCNHRCPYCFYRYARTNTLNALFNENDVFDYERLCALIKEFSKLGIGAVQYTGGGEPFMYPRIYEVLELTAASGMEFAIVTNGGLLDPKRTDILKRASWIRFSLDAATSATHIKSQRPKNPEFFQTLDKIRRVVLDCPNTVVGVSFVVNPINYKEVYRAAECAKKIGAYNIRFSVAYTPRGIDLYKEIWPEFESQARQAKKLEDKNFKVFNLITNHLENLDMKQKGYSFCGYQHFTAVIGSDMEVYPCCTLKYNPLGKLGNLKDKTFLELWTVGSARSAWLKRDHLKLVCDKNPCWMDSKNQFLSYLVSKNPPHVNFV